MRPTTANELWSAFTEIFPVFATDSPEQEIELGASLHSVVRNFVPYFSGHLQTFSEKQIKSLAHLINDAVTIEDDLENAFSTCFLEHLGQVRCYKTLAPHLSRLAKDKSRA